MIGQLCVSHSAARHRSSLFKQINFSLSTAGRERRGAETGDCVWVGSPQYVYSGFHCSSQLCCFPLAFTVVWHFKRPGLPLVTSIPGRENVLDASWKTRNWIFINIISMFLSWKITVLRCQWICKQKPEQVEPFFLMHISNHPTIDTMGNKLYKLLR